MILVNLNLSFTSQVKKILFILCSLLLLIAIASSSMLFVLFTSNILKDFRIDQLKATSSLPIAFLVNCTLLILFGLQHTLMARKSFKQIARKIIPLGLERMLYGLMSSVALAAIVFFWQPMPIILWDIKTEWIQIILFAIFFLAWFFVLIAATLIDAFELIGIRQLANYFLKWEKKLLQFKTPFLYKIVRHPIYTGLLVAFWVSPIMTLSHFLFSIGMTIYILIGIYFEEKDLVEIYGREYQSYQKTTAKLIPWKRHSN